MTLRSGDCVYQSFVSVTLDSAVPQVAKIRLVEPRPHGRWLAHDERLGQTRIVDEADVGEVFCRSEVEAWSACRIALLRVSDQCRSVAEVLP
jgi:hypothetical protein